MSQIIDSRSGATKTKKNSKSPSATAPGVAMTFGVLGTNVVHVDDVENGLSCGCACPSCGERLVAKQGSKTVHHFAHESGSDCRGGLETALHLAAKSLLSKHMRMRLPGLTVRATAKDAKGGVHEAERSFPSILVRFDEVAQEAGQGSFVPDILARKGARTLAVEIAVHHFVGDDKRAKLRAAGMAAVEVDLSDKVSGWTWDELTAAVIESPEGKTWVHLQKEGAMRAEAECEARSMAEQADARSMRLAAQIHAAKLRKRAQTPDFEKAVALLMAWSKSGKFEADAKAMEQQAPPTGAWESAARVLRLTWVAVPSYFDIPVKGEAGFMVARRAWQAGVFAWFIQANRASSFDPRATAKWALDTFPTRRDFIVLQRGEDLLTEEERAALPWASVAVREYLRELETLGFLKETGGRYRILRRHGF